MPKIDKPTRLVHWLYTDGEDIVRTGVTDPGLVTTSGLPILIQNTNEAQFLLDIAAYSRKMEVRPARDEDAVADQVYDDGGTPKLVRRNRR